MTSKIYRLLYKLRIFKELLVKSPYLSIGNLIEAMIKERKREEYLERVRMRNFYGDWD